MPAFSPPPSAATACPSGRRGGGRWRRGWRALALLAALASGPLAAGPTQLPLRSYDQDGGLTTLSVTRLGLDGDGDLWVGTEMGLYRYDGLRFVDVGPDQGFAVSEVVALADGGERFWVATRAGLQYRHGQRFRTVAGATGPIRADRGQTLAPRPDGSLLLVSGRRLWRLSPRAAPEAAGWTLAPAFTPAQVRQHPSLAQVSAVFAHGDTLWMGCGQAVCRVQGERIEVFGPGQGVPAGDWRAFAATRDGSLWVRSPRALRRLPAGQSRFLDQDIPAGKGDVAASSLDMVEDPAGRLLTRDAQGLARWDGRLWEHFGTDEGIPDVGLSALARARDGSIWLGTFGRGLLHWDGYDRVENWSSRQGLGSPLTWSLARVDADHVWIAHEQGGNVIDVRDGTVHPWPLQLAPPLQARTLVTDGRGRVWVFLFDGRILRYDGTDGRTVAVSRVPDFVRTGFRDRAGRVWAAGIDGLYRVGDDGQARREAPGVIPPGMCSDLAEDDGGTLWAACSSGLYRRAPEGPWRRVDVVSAGASPEGYEHVAVAADGRVWLSSTEPGLYEGRIEGPRLRLAAVTDPLLATSRFYFLRLDRQGRVWAGGGHGVDVLDHDHWTRLTRSDGLVWNEMDHNAFLADDDGSVWLGTANGVSRLLAPDALLRSRTPQPRILSLRYGQAVLDPARAHTLAAGRPLDLRLGALGNETGRPLQFRYRLLGLDQDWIQTDTPVLRYPPLAPGRYRFQLQILDVDRRALSPLLGFGLDLRPPWWGSAWARAIAACLVLLLVAGLWRWRHRHLLARNRRLEQAVAARTAELEQEKRELERTQRQLRHQATHDELTGLPNRPAIMQELRARLAAGDPGVAVALIDIDHFKRINDRYGHLAGDQVLADLGQWLARHAPDGCRIGRYGGEEFLLLLPAADAGQALAVLHPFRQALSRAVHPRQSPSEAVTCSMGMAWAEPGTPVERLLERTDRRLYRAKGRGRDHLVADGD
ncbi:ligand-binding sensor domain-containing diguanylate cyclase [Xanthomonas massiliensis]|uniref:ligand-binding sensor domain-containing diguanylate cyclase n=1 Tax=Xanthomonas massiliensis TaxID=1720302 RepID=UPI0008258A22|nr:diguanylate cyclase [Xanthomonas massiliensis]